MRTPTVAIGLAIVLAAALGGFAGYRLATSLSGAASGSGSAALPSPAPPAGAPGAAPTGPPGPRVLPAVLPDFTLQDRDGQPRRLADWQGRSLVVNFWATWCAPCRREIPLLMALRRQRAAEGVEVIGIAVDLRDAVLEYAQQIGLDYPLLIGENDGLEAIDAFGMQAVFPFTVFADRLHRIVALKVGELHREEADFILDRVREVNQDRLELEGARAQIAARLRELAARRARLGANGSDPVAKDP